VGANVAKWLLGVPRNRWECNIEMDVTGGNCEDGRWMEPTKVLSCDKM
jgi:hypothetical protein